VKPYWTNGRATLWQGHVLDALAAMEAGSAHCAVTSPPYWGLRSYPCPPIEWGPVSYAPMAGLPEIEIPGCDPECEHVWGEERVVAAGNAPSHKSTLTTNAGKGPLPGDKYQADQNANASQGQYCQRCGGWRGSLGLEPDPAMFVGHIVLVARELWRVLRDDATWWLNFGDSYNNRSISRPSSHQTGLGFESEHLSTTWADLTKQGNTRLSLKNGLKEKDLIGIPWRVAFALQADGWWLRSDVIWAKGVSFCPTYSGSCMPESCKDRPTKGHEYVFLLAKSARYFYDATAVREPSSPTSAGNRREFRGGGAYTNGNSFDNSASKENETPGNDGLQQGRNLRTVWTINPGSYREWGETSRLVRVGLDDVSDGTIYIASPSCPAHGCQDRPSGERANAETSHTERTGADRVRVPLLWLAANSKHRALCCPNCSLDSLGLVRSHVATAHNRQSRKTARAPETNSPCTPCVGMTSHTGDKSESLLCAVMRENMPDCNTWPDEMDVRLLEKIPYRTVDKSSLPIPPECLCGFYHKVTEKSSHFATFPPALVEPMIKAGTSAKGVCPECGAPWERVTEKGELSGEAIIQDTERPAASVRGVSESSILRTNGRTFRPITTTGWAPTCQCDAGPPVPATVLDPFLGSGTTAEVAIRLGRRAVGIELSQDYCDEHIIPRLEQPLQMEMAL